MPRHRALVPERPKPYARPVPVESADDAEATMSPASPTPSNARPDSPASPNNILAASDDAPAASSTLSISPCSGKCGHDAAACVALRAHVIDALAKVDRIARRPDIFNLIRHPTSPLCEGFCLLCGEQALVSDMTMFAADDTDGPDEDVVISLAKRYPSEKIPADEMKHSVICYHFGCAECLDAPEKIVPLAVAASCLLPSPELIGILRSVAEKVRDARVDSDLGPTADDVSSMTVDELLQLYHKDLSDDIVDCTDDGLIKPSYIVGMVVLDREWDYASRSFLPFHALLEAYQQEKEHLLMAEKRAQDKLAKLARQMREQGN